nr:MAG TPA: Stress-induced transcription factor NAC1 family, Stress-responsive, DNA BINDING.6A [Caudoviricetes sp.]
MLSLWVIFYSVGVLGAGDLVICRIYMSNARCSLTANCVNSVTYQRKES